MSRWPDLLGPDGRQPDREDAGMLAGRDGESTSPVGGEPMSGTERNGRQGLSGVGRQRVGTITR